MANGVNALAVGEGSSILFQMIDMMLKNTEDHTLVALTDALESSEGETFLNALLAALDPAALAAGINPGLDPSQSSFLVDNLANTDADMMARINSNALNDLLGELLGTNPGPSLLDASAVASALNSGLEPLLEGLLSTLDGVGAAGTTAGIADVDNPGADVQTVTITKPNTFALFTDMLADNATAAEVIAGAINNAINDDTGNTGFMHNFGMRVRLRFYAVLFGIPIGLDAIGVGIIDGAYTGPLRMEGDPNIPDWDN